MKLHPVLKVRVYYNCNKCRGLAKIKMTTIEMKMKIILVIFPIVSNNFNLSTEKCIVLTKEKHSN